MPPAWLALPALPKRIIRRSVGAPGSSPRAWPASQPQAEQEPARSRLRHQGPSVTAPVSNPNVLQSHDQHVNLTAGSVSAKSDSKAAHHPQSSNAPTSSGPSSTTAKPYRKFGSIVSSTLLHPSRHNVPMPRLKPQPPFLSMMIKNRIKQSQKRLDLLPELKGSLKDVELEKAFEEGLLPHARTEVRQQWKDYELGVQQMLQAINQANKRDIKRAQTKVSPEVMKELHMAKQRRIEYHTAKKARHKLRAQGTLSKE